MATSTGAATPIIQNNAFVAAGAVRGDFFRQPMSTQLQVATPGESVTINTVFRCSLTDPVRKRGDFIVESTTRPDRACASISLSTPQDTQRIARSDHDDNFYRNVSQTPEDAVTYVFYRDGQEFSMTVSDATRTSVPQSQDDLVRYHEMGGVGAIYRSNRRVIYCPDDRGVDASANNFAKCQTFLLQN
jgi:hypothetical protein